MRWKSQDLWEWIKMGTRGRRARIYTITTPPGPTPYINSSENLCPLGYMYMFQWKYNKSRYQNDSKCTYQWQNAYMDLEIFQEVSATIAQIWCITCANTSSSSNFDKKSYNNSHTIHGTGIFTFMNGWFLWSTQVNIPYMDPLDDSVQSVSGTLGFSAAKGCHKSCRLDTKHQ